MQLRPGKIPHYSRAAFGGFVDLLGIEDLPFQLQEFFQAALVPALFKRRQQPGVYDPADQFVAEEVGRKTKDVGIIMPAGDFGGEFVVADGGARMPKILLAAMDMPSPLPSIKTPLRLPIGNASGGRDGKVRVVTRFGRISAEINEFMSAIGDLRNDALFDGKAAMITSNGDFHSAISLKCRESNS